MRFMMTYQIRAEYWDKAVSRFLETGAPAPAGVTPAGSRRRAGTVSCCWREMMQTAFTALRPNGTMSAT